MFLHYYKNMKINKIFSISLKIVLKFTKTYEKFKFLCEYYLRFYKIGFEFSKLKISMVV